MKTLIVVFSLMLLIAGLGCAALSTRVTLADIDEKAVIYAVNAGVAEPNDYSGYPNLLKAGKLQAAVDIAHTVRQFNFQQLIEGDNLEYSIHKDVVKNNFVASQALEETVFGEKGLLTLGLSLAGFGTLTGCVGLMRKRPGDVTSTELEQVVAQATGKTTGELSAKQKQFIQVVKGVSEFMKIYKGTTNNKEAVMMKELKAACNEAQDTTTRIAVTQVNQNLV